MNMFRGNTLYMNTLNMHTTETAACSLRSGIHGCPGGTAPNYQPISLSLHLQQHNNKHTTTQQNRKEPQDATNKTRDAHMAGVRVVLSSVWRAPFSIRSKAIALYLCFFRAAAVGRLGTENKKCDDLEMRVEMRSCWAR